MPESGDNDDEPSAGGTGPDEAGAGGTADGARVGDGTEAGAEPGSNDGERENADGVDDGDDGNGDGVDDGDTFGVGVHVAAEEFRFVVHVPSEIDSGWTDPEAFQSRIEQVTWEQLDQRETLRAVARTAEEGETVSLGTVTMRPDGEVVDHSLSSPET